MTYVEHHCPRCFGPLPAPPPSGTIYCDYCWTPLSPGPDGWTSTAPAALDEDLPDPDRPRFWVKGRRWVALGRVAEGESSRVFLGRRDHRLTERVVIKLARDEDARPKLEHEHEVLTALQASRARGTAHFSRLIPQPVAIGEARLGMRGDEGARFVSLLRHRSGFVHTFDHVRDAWREGVPPEAAVWLLKRALELLGWTHESGWTHGAVEPAHLLVHARDHGVTLLGWTEARRGGDAAADVRAAAGAVRSLVKKAPAPLTALLAEAEASAGPDAWALIGRLDEVSRRAFGPPRYVAFPMPGWDL